MINDQYLQNIKKFSKCNTEKSNVQIRKQAKDMNKYFTKKDKQMKKDKQAHEKWLIPLAFGKCRSKPQ